MEVQGKLRIIEEILGFLLDEPFLETANAFPSPEDVIEDWYLTATIFQNVQEKQQIPDEHREALHILVEEAEAEYKASEMLGEKPDVEEELGLGYDGYEIPEGFAAKHQGAIWKEVIAVHGTDERPREWTIETE
jgi:hypothetical protein